MKVAIIGTQGVPAQYGGFETLAENLILRKSSDGIEYTVFCSGRDYASRQPEFAGARLIYIPFFRSNGIQSIPYDILSLIRASRGFDVIVVLGTSGCVFLPVFRLICRKKLIVNIDGLEHRREKWGKYARKFLRLCESMAIRHSDHIVVDNAGIEQYVRQSYGTPSVLITYGADQAKMQTGNDRQDSILESYGLKPGGYALALCRIEPENNCRMILEACDMCGEKLVFVGNWHRNEYGSRLREEYKGHSNITMLDAIYDTEILYALRSNCRLYLHGHSAGGTNPSLVEAMILGIPIMAYDCIYNRMTTEDKAHFFTDATSLSESLSTLYDELATNGGCMCEIAERRYTWSKIVAEYESLYK